MVRIDAEAIWLFRPGCADELVGCQPFKGLQALGEVVGIQECCEMRFQLLASGVMVAPDGGFLDGPVHALDLAIGPGMVWLCQPVPDAVLAAAQVEHMRHVPRCRPIAFAGLVAELHAVVGEDGVDLVGNGLDRGFEESRGGFAVRFGMEPGEGELGCPVDGNAEIKLAFLGAERNSAISMWKQPIG
jgi:hypothetical protein